MILPQQLKPNNSKLKQVQSWQHTLLLFFWQISTKSKSPHNFRLLSFLTSLCLILFKPTSAGAVSVQLNGTSTILSGTDCDIATYRFPSNTTYQGQALDILVEVLQEENDLVDQNPFGEYCITPVNNSITVDIADRQGDNNTLAFMDLKITVVAQGTTTPVEVDRLAISGFDLDTFSGVDTDDIYFFNPDGAYVSSASNVTPSTGSFFGGQYNVKLKGQGTGDCSDTPGATSDVACRGGGIFITGDNGLNTVSSVQLRVQNDNAYSTATDNTSLRRFQLSLEIGQIEELVTDNTDFGDADNSYQSAGTSVSTSLSLGNGIFPDNEATHQFSADATGDDTDTTPVSDFDDDDGVQLNNQPLDNQSLEAGATTNLDVTTFGTGFLSGWLDLNADGTFDAGEQVIDDLAINSSTITNSSVPVTIPASATAGNVAMRFRFSQDQNVTATGTASNGEVEDYQIAIASSLELDYGDAPDTYGTDDTGGNSSNTSDPVGASHIIDSRLYLGVTPPDQDSNGFVDGTDDNGNATDDDDPLGTGTGNGDDEGDLTLPTLTEGDTSYTIPAADITATNTTGGEATLHGWIDFNNNGTFENTEYANVTVDDTTNGGNPAGDLVWTGITAGAAGNTYARFRLTTDSSINATTPGGNASDGEVEDYQLAIAQDLSDKACPGAIADLWFANDESGSVSNAEFNDGLDFLYQISDAFVYDDVSGVKAGVTGWGSNVNSAEIVIPITESFGDPGDSGLISTGGVTTDGDGSGLRELYNRKINTSRGTRLNFATNYLADLIIAGNGRRADTPQLAVILTDASNNQLSNSNSGGGNAWITEADRLRTAGPDGTRIIVIVIEEAAAAYNAGGTARTTIDAVAGTDGLVLVVPTYQEAADPVNGYIDQVTNAVCNTIGDKLQLLGTVFEDINYGGGTGRNFAAAETSATSSGFAINGTNATGINNARVELYSYDGADTSTSQFLEVTTTDNDGNYSFEVNDGNYLVRVVNNTINSNRDSNFSGETEIAVQTFRNDPDGATTEIIDEVGGANPTVADPGNVTALNDPLPNDAQSVTAINVSGSDVNSVDFGFNFDTIVNTNDAGQGSLRQFIINSNELDNNNLAQDLPAALTPPLDKDGNPVTLTDYETSIFMIPDPNNDNRVTSGVGTGLINLTSSPPDGGTGNALVIDISNTGTLTLQDSFTSLDGRTQNINIPSISNSENLTIGSNETTGAEVIITSSSNDEIISGLFSNLIFHDIGIVNQESGNSIGILLANNGTTSVQAADTENIIMNDLTVVVGNCGIEGVRLVNSVIRDTVLRDSGANSLCDNIQLRRNSNNNLIEDNLILRSFHYGIDLVITDNSDNIIRGNQIVGNGIANADNQSGGIGIRSGTNTTIANNIIRGNIGDGITVTNVNLTSTSNRITQNSIYNNGDLAIDLGSTNSGDGVTNNDSQDSDSGINQLQNFPTFTSIVNDGVNYIIEGSLDSTPNSNFEIELFSNAVCNPNTDGIAQTESPFGEGEKYHLTIPVTTDASGQATFSTNIAISEVAGRVITATATATASNDTSEFSQCFATSPDLLLVKRITAINPGESEERLFDEFVDDDTEDDNNSKWLGSSNSTNTYTLGETDGGQVTPGDVIEYTIYYLSNGSDTAQNVLVCDPIPENTEFIANDFDTLPGATGGISGTDRGLVWEYNGVTESLTNGNDGDNGYYFAPGVDPTTVAALSNVNCGGVANNNGSVVVNLNNLAPAIAPGSPLDSYGLIRFRVKVK
ncbi:MAG: GEVED domain-containing protein [Cyanobacteria bacterium P01_G01_bin.39]